MARRQAEEERARQQVRGGVKDDNPYPDLDYAVHYDGKWLSDAEFLKARLDKLMPPVKVEWGRIAKRRSDVEKESRSSRSGRSGVSGAGSSG